METTGWLQVQLTPPPPRSSHPLDRWGALLELLFGTLPVDFRRSHWRPSFEPELVRQDFGFVVVRWRCWPARHFDFLRRLSGHHYPFFLQKPDTEEQRARNLTF